MVRKLVALVAGFAAAVLVMMVVEAIGNQIVPPPRGYDLSQGSAEGLPTATLIPPVLGWFLGSLTGGLVALRIASARWIPWGIGAGVLAATIMNLVLIRHPVWVMIAGLIVPLAGAWIAQTLGRRTA